MNNERTISDFRSLLSIPQLVRDFLNREVPGLEDSLFTIESIRKQIEQQQGAFSGHERALLCEELERQHGYLPIAPEQKESLGLLKQENTFTVCTGHQLSLFTGPVFFIYKILQTIKTAHYLRTELPEFNFVPIFWMASEDHDLDEIDHFSTLQATYHIQGESGGAVGRIVPKDISFNEAFSQEVRDTVYGTELSRLLMDAYTPGKNLAESTREIVQHLFSSYGLLVLDGDTRTLKQEMIPYFKEELLNQSLFHETKGRNELIIKKYGGLQVNPRSINLFHLDKIRERIEFHNGGFRLLETGEVFSVSGLMEVLEKFPERFSPNALLRPLYQQKILPNIAYIGGNAEIMYWIQLPEYFSKMGIPFPILIPRNSLLFLSKKTGVKIEKLQRDPIDFFQPLHQFLKSYLLEESALKDKIDQLEKGLKDAFEQLGELAQKTEGSFMQMVEAEQARQTKSYNRFRKRLLRAEKIKHGEKVERIEQLYNEIHPRGLWQERVLNFSVFYRDYGKDWLQNCYQEMEVTKSALIILPI